jgi:hypothetical protein
LTNFDPFEDVPADETEPAPFEPAPQGKPQPVFATDPEGKLVVTLKGGAGFDAPWIVYHAASVDDALGLFVNESSKLATLMEKVQGAGKFFGGLAPTKPANSSGGAPARPGAEAPPGTPEAPGPDWTYKTGVGKNGKTWKAWMPPRGSSENPVWL